MFFALDIAELQLSASLVLMDKLEIIILQHLQNDENRKQLSPLSYFAVMLDLLFLLFPVGSTADGQNHITIFHRWKKNKKADKYLTFLNNILNNVLMSN